MPSSLIKGLFRPAIRNNGICFKVRYLTRARRYKKRAKSAYHVDGGEDTRPVPEPRGRRPKLLCEWDANKTKGDIRHKVPREEDELHPRWQGPDVDGRT